MSYNREAAVNYAHKWAFARNPRYYDFDSIGGDCTNFISQCLYAGAGVMNRKPVMGWYYDSPGSRTASWSGVRFLYNFLTTNKGTGPYGGEEPLTRAMPGDVIQLSFDGEVYAHSLLVVDITGGQILIATHTIDSDYRPLSSYTYVSDRLISIYGVRGN